MASFPLSLWSLFLFFAVSFVVVVVVVVASGENQINRERNLGGCFEHWHLKLGGQHGKVLNGDGRMGERKPKNR